MVSMLTYLIYLDKIKVFPKSFESIQPPDDERIPSFQFRNAGSETWICRKGAR